MESRLNQHPGYNEQILLIEALFQSYNAKAYAMFWILVFNQCIIKYKNTPKSF